MLRIEVCASHRRAARTLSTERRMTDEFADALTDEELIEFIKGGLEAGAAADPVFREHLRERLLTLVKKNAAADSGTDR